MRATYGIPGPGGSLGKCILCGETFLTEIIMGTKVQMIEVDGIKGNLPIHTKCLEVLDKNGPDWQTLPDGPLKEVFAEHNKTLHTP